MSKLDIWFSVFLIAALFSIPFLQAENQKRINKEMAYEAECQNTLQHVFEYPVKMLDRCAQFLSQHTEKRKDYH